MLQQRSVRIPSTGGGGTLTITGSAANFTVAGLTMTAAGTGYTGTPIYTFGSGNATPGTVTLSSVTLATDSSIGGTGDIVINPAISDGGGAKALTKVGTNTLILPAVNTYSGATTVNVGKLVGVVGGSSASSAVSVAATTGNIATLGVFITDNTKQWTCASLTVNNAGTSSSLDFNFGLIAPSTTVAPLKVTGAATFTTTPAVTVELAGANVVASGVYPLMTWGSGGASAPTTVTVNTGSLRSTVTGHLSVTGGNTLNLVVDSVTASTEPLSWTGGNGTWDVGNSANTIWKDNTSASTYYLAGDTVVFNNTVGSGGVVTLNMNVSPVSITVTNPSANYTISGSGAIAGSASLSKSGAGTLTLSTTNTYSGGTTLNAGEIDLNNTNALGTGTINVNGGILKLIGGGTVTNALSIAGTCSLGGSSAEVWNGSVNLNGSVQTITNITFNQFGGIISNGGIRLEKPAGFQYGFWLVNVANTYAGGTFLDGPQLDISSVAVLGTGPLEIVSSSWVVLEAANLELSSKLKIDDSANLSLDTGANLSTFTNAWACGPLGTAALTKLGTGTLTLTAVNTNSGSTTISAGTLALTGTAGLPNTSLISIASGAAFNVSGLSSVFGLGGGQTLSNFALATGTIIGSLNTGSGTVSVSYTNGTPSLTVTNGTLTLAANTVFKITNSGPALGAGSYKIISKGAGGVVAGVPTSVTASGLAANTSASLTNISSELWLLVQNITTNTLATSGSPSTYGQSVTFTCTITPAPATVGETISFLDGTTTIGTGTNNAGGVATFTTSRWPPVRIPLRRFIPAMRTTLAAPTRPF